MEPIPANEPDDQFTEEETARRAEAVIKRMAETPPKPHRPGKRRELPANQESRVGNKSRS